MAAGLKLVCALMLCMLVAAAPMANAMTCGQVSVAMKPCMGYLMSGGDRPPTPCCNGVKSLVSQARTTTDRQQACECLKSAAGAMHNLKRDVAAGLPDKCGVNIPYKISSSTNCKSVK
ncbi:hypothetical protein SLE2022_342050 [Rubroshorea leprosula]